MTPRIIIHGGAGRAMQDPARGPAIRQSLRHVVTEVAGELKNGASARDAVVKACVLLEDDELFNAGTGSALQSDGQSRLSASLMNGAEQSFSGIINGRRLRHPIELAAFLQGEYDRVLAADGVDELARELGVPIWDNVSERRLTEWIAERKRDFERDMATVTAEDTFERRGGTIGAVALDASGQIVAGTSTGGRGFERIGRVSDSATPAGNYANADAGVSATGVGEHILDEGLATRIVVRVTDGMSLEEAMRRSMDEGVSRGRNFGAIALDRRGNIVYGKTSDILLSAYFDGTAVHDTVDLPLEPLTRAVPCGD